MHLYTHTQMRTHSHICTHTHTHTHTLAHSLIPATHIHMHTYTITHTFLHIQLYTHPYTHTRTQRHSHTHTYTSTLAVSLTHTYTHIVWSKCFCFQRSPRTFSKPMYGTRPWCLVQTITRHTCPDPDLGSWNCLPYQAHIAPSWPMSSIDQQVSSLGSFPTFPFPSPLSPF